MYLLGVPYVFFSAKESFLPLLKCFSEILKSSEIGLIQKRWIHDVTFIAEKPHLCFAMYIDNFFILVQIMYEVAQCFRFFSPKTVSSYYMKSFLKHGIQLEIFC
jgi:hypothetical protein